MDCRQPRSIRRDHIQFGDGIEGARLPSGTAKVRVRYRKGIGTGGNVGAGSLTTLLSRPLGVSEAINPEPAHGGEDAEDLAHARSNAPLTVMTLDRAALDEVAVWEDEPAERDE